MFSAYIILDLLRLSALLVAQGQDFRLLQIPAFVIVIAINAYIHV